MGVGSTCLSCHHDSTTSYKNAGCFNRGDGKMAPCSHVILYGLPMLGCFICYFDAVLDMPCERILRQHIYVVYCSGCDLPRLDPRGQISDVGAVR